jgi:hypothetical protein
MGYFWNKFQVSRFANSNVIVWVMWLMGSPENHSRDHGDQPDEPDHNAETVEVVDHFFIFPYKDNGCPDCMKTHEEDCDVTGNPMKCQGKHGSGKNAHGGGANGICSEPCPEKNGVPPGKPALNPLSPYTDRIQYKCKDNKDNGDNQHKTIFSGPKIAFKSFIMYFDYSQNIVRVKNLSVIVNKLTIIYQFAR